MSIYHIGTAGSEWQRSIRFSYKRWSWNFDTDNSDSLSALKLLVNVHFKKKREISSSTDVAINGSRLLEEIKEWSLSNSLSENFFFPLPCRNKLISVLSPTLISVFITLTLLAASENKLHTSPLCHSHLIIKPVLITHMINDDFPVVKCQ